MKVLHGVDCVFVIDSLKTKIKNKRTSSFDSPSREKWCWNVGRKSDYGRLSERRFIFRHF